MAYLSKLQCRNFEDQGYLVIDGALSNEDLEPVKNEYDELLTSVGRKLVAQGSLRSAYENLSFNERYPRMLSECRQVFPNIDITYPVSNSLLSDWNNDPPGHFGEAVLNLITHPKVLDIVESIIGPEILSNPTQHLRLKPPETLLEITDKQGYVGRTDWHQDLAGLLDEALDTKLLTVWIAVSDASEQQGCLVVIPESHKYNQGKLTAHCPEGPDNPSNYIASENLATGPQVPLPVKSGAIVLFHRLTQHASLENRSDQLRFAFDLRYQPIGYATGRPAFPGFVARSRRDPTSELRSYKDWQELWKQSLEALQRGDSSGPIYETRRWESNSGLPPC